MSQSNDVQTAFQRGEGIFRMIPCWVPRNFNQAGQRIRLHPDDYYALGLERGSIKERWFSSVTPADNGPSTPWDEGMSYIATSDDPADKILLRDAVQALGAALLGEELWEKYGNWPMYSKFFDYKLPIFHHLHLDDTAAKRVGRLGKPEAYYFPVQMNNYPGEFPVTYFGLDPSTTKEMLRERLVDYEKRDTRITELSRAYRLRPGTGWYVPAGVLHAPGSLCTYEPQWNSDVSAGFENMAAGEVFLRNSLVSNVPDEQKDNLDYIMDLLDWDVNVDPYFSEHYFRPPLPIPHNEAGYTEKWITYNTPWFSAKELSVEPGASVTVKDGAAYGCILIQGHGTFGPYAAEAAILLRYGQLSADEFFVSEQAADAGVKITNRSHSEPFVMLKHFGPNHPAAPR